MTKMVMIQRDPVDTAAALDTTPAHLPADQTTPSPSRGSVRRLVAPTGRPLGHLDLLESLAIFIIREVAAEAERPVLLFSGGKDSAVLLHLASKAFRPGRIPFPVLHVDTGHNFPEVLDYRDAQVEAEGARLVVAKVQDSIDQGRVADPGLNASPQPVAVDHPARRHQRQQVRCRLWWCPPGRGQSPRQGTGPLVP